MLDVFPIVYQKLNQIVINILELQIGIFNMDFGIIFLFYIIFQFLRAQFVKLTLMLPPKSINCIKLIVTILEKKTNQYRLLAF